MATFRLRHFSNLRILRSIAPNRLLAFLTPYSDFFTARGYKLPLLNSGEEIEYQRLIDIFMSPTEASPRELLDALFLVDEMSTSEGMDALINAAHQTGMALDEGDEHSPADIAIQVWLRDKEILEHKHAEEFLFRPKTFEYYQSTRMLATKFELPSAEKLQMLEEEFDDWFDKMRRGRRTRVFMYPDHHNVKFLVRHGEPFKREEGMGDADVVSVCYRPLKYDVVVYDQRLRELLVNAKLVGEKKLYRQKFGKYLFDNENCFPGTAKYGLEPLREYGADSLACGNIDGIESIVLSEIHFSWGGPRREVEIHKATDVFAALKARGRQMPENARIVTAVFKVKFDDASTPRSVRIRPSNIAEYTRDADAEILEQWLKLRGFMVAAEAAEHVESAVAST